MNGNRFELVLNMLISIQCELRIDLMRRTWETEAHNRLWNKNKVMMWNFHYCLGCRKQVQLQSWKRFNQKCPEFNGAASGCSAVAMATLNGKLHGNLKSICKRRSSRPLCLQYLVSYDLGQHPGVYSKQSRNLKKNRRHFYKCECDRVLLPWQKHAESHQVQFQPSLLEATVPKTWQSSSGCTRGCSLEPEDQTPTSAKNSKHIKTDGWVAHWLMD